MDVTPLNDLFRSLPLFMLVFCRIGALFVSAPVIGGSYAPIQVRALLAAAVSAVVVPLAVAQGAVVPLDGMFFVYLVKEVFVGLSLGWFVSLFFHAIHFGADLIGRHAGFAAAENFNPATENMAGPIGDLFYLSLLLLFLLGDGHLYFIAAIARSYEAVPVGMATWSPAVSATVVEASNQMFIIALTFSFPVLGTILALTVAEGIITRAVPQINFLHFSFAIKIMVSLLVLVMGIPAAVLFMSSILHLAQEAGWGFVRMLGA